MLTKMSCQIHVPFTATCITTATHSQKTTKLWSCYPMQGFGLMFLYAIFRSIFFCPISFKFIIQWMTSLIKCCVRAHDKMNNVLSKMCLVRFFSLGSSAVISYYCPKLLLLHFEVHKEQLRLSSAEIIFVNSLLFWL